MDNYWEIKTRDNLVVQIPPHAVDVVKRRWDAGQPIHTTNNTIPAHQIVSFEKTARVRTDVALLESTAQAFREPLVNEDESIQCKWVKKSVPSNMYGKHYGNIPGYKNLGADNGMVTIAFRLPIHQIDHNTVQPCNEDEIKRLTTKL